MNTCKTCKHWRTFDRCGIARVKGALGNLVPARNGKMMGLCARASINDADGNDQDSNAMAQDASDYSYCLRTAPDFGCNQYEVEEK